MAAGEIRSNKVVKKTKDRKLSKSLDKDLMSQALEEDQASPNDSEAKRSDKKPQGIVIDGKTYTCATCKAGHRVGVCKHGRERPMKATHPPGRPPAGAPKKVVCDCPKSCSCTKKDCKCARRCNCIQTMYMLVYIPAPDEDENPEDEKGSWKLGEQVMTDLKGNILTPEQVKERREKKDAMKTLLPLGSKSPNGPIIANEPKPDTASSSSPEPSSCCKHKENVSGRNIAAQASPDSGVVPKSSADGCNCGHLCNCAFCPQHPNNSTSLNVARQQAMHFANHPSMDGHSIVPFLPTMPQNMSCMGGQPRFAMSMQSGRPSFKQLQTIFPNPGYVIGYPVWPLRHDDNGLGMEPFQAENEASYSESITMPPTTTPATLQYSVLPVNTTQSPQDFQFAQDDYGIGDAFVASAGIEGWNNDAFAAGSWNLDDAATTTPFSHTATHVDASNPFHSISSELNSVVSPITTPFLNFVDADTHQIVSQQELGGSIPVDASQSLPSKSVPLSSCCQPATTNMDLGKSDQPFSPSLAFDGRHQYGEFV